MCSIFPSACHYLLTLCIVFSHRGNILYSNLLINRHAVKCVAVLLMTSIFCHSKTDILKLKNSCMNFKKYCIAVYF